MKTTWTLMLAVLMSCMFVNVTQADEPDWKKNYPNYTLLAEKKVDREKDKDTLEVGGEGKYVGLLLNVTDGGLEVYEIKVKFQEGEDYAPDIRHKFMDGERTKQFDLPGEARAIREVTFRFTSQEHKGKVTVKLCGTQAAAKVPLVVGLTKMPESKEGYQYLGSNEVSVAKDRDKIEVGENNTRFSAIMLGVVDQDLEMWDIKIEYADGAEYSPNTRLKFDKNNRCRILDIPTNAKDDNNGAKRLQRVNFSYKGTKADGKVMVKLYGKPTVSAKRFKDHKFIGTLEIDLAKTNGTITVGESKGKFKTVLIEVENADVSLKDIVFKFGSGNNWEPGKQLDFDEGWRFRKIEMPGDNRTIASVTFNYTPKGAKSGKAIVNVFGNEK